MEIGPRYEGDVIISIEGSAVDPLTPMARQRRRLEALVGALPEDEWGHPTRCAGWSVQDVIAHLVTVNQFWNASVRAGRRGQPTRFLVGFDPAATPPLLVEPMRALAPAAMLEQFVTTNDAFLDELAELDADGWAMVAEAPPGHIPIHLLSDHALWDGWVHERDIALPLGSTPPIERDEVAASLRYVAALSPAFAVTTGTSTDGVLAIDATGPAVQFVLDVGDTVSIHDGPIPAGTPCLCGETVDLIEFLSIRAPLPASAPPEWRRTLAGLAAVFNADPPPT